MPGRRTSSSRRDRSVRLPGCRDPVSAAAGCGHLDLGFTATSSEPQAAALGRQSEAGLPSRRASIIPRQASTHGRFFAGASSRARSGSGAEPSVLVIQRREPITKLVTLSAGLLSRWLGSLLMADRALVTALESTPFPSGRRGRRDERSRLVELQRAGGTTAILSDPKSTPLRSPAIRRRGGAWLPTSP
jgi:hypothetical protein